MTAIATDGTVTDGTVTEDVETEQIEAGAVLPGAAATGEDRDTVSARHYEHPGLPERTVVRLVPAALAPADDLTMSYLGFGEPVRATDVGVGRRRALGFPAWALINDPANAHHALNLVKDLERLARVAKSSPGSARDALLALGEQLGRSAPHFLPTFYEQAGRIYLETGSVTYAASMFGKAREAEDVHSLTVDPHRQRAVFLEFAFAGALTAKSLSGYARTLAGRHGADEAYRLFATLCLERTKGGLPPYSGMPEDLRRLAKAAKLSVPAEDAAMLRAVLDTPAVGRAGAGFWKSYRKALISLAKSDPAVRGRLLAFVPESADCHELWLEILTEGDVTPALTLPAADVDPLAAPPAGAAGWLSLMAARRNRSWSQADRSVTLLNLVSAMADRLRANGEQVRLFTSPHTVDLDLLDLCLAERIPLTEPPERARLDVAHWRRDGREGRRDLVAVAEDDRLRPALADGLLGHLRRNNQGVVSVQAFDTVRATPGLLTALRHWLADMADRTGATGFGGIRRCLRSLETVRLPSAYVEVPEVARRIADIDLTGALTTALRGGLFDELGWPALEDAVSALAGAESPKPGEQPTVTVVGEGWPALVLANGERIVVVGPDGILLEHVARIPPESRRRWAFQFSCTYVDGRLLVAWAGPEHSLAYWSDAPERVFPLAEGHYRYYAGDQVASVPLPGGGRFTGGRAVHVGDDVIPEAREVLSDGTTYWSWRSADRGDGWRWREVDVATGEVGRASLPGFLEDFADDDASIHLGGSDVRPVAPGTESSPLGQANGLHGWRVRRESDGNWTAERIDGERFRVSADMGRPRLAVRLPGDQRSRVVAGNAGNMVSLFDPDGVEIAVLQRSAHRPELARGTALVPPDNWWHCLRVRDEAGSLALRAIGREQVAKLLAAAVAEQTGEADSGGGIARRLPKLFGGKGNATGLAAVVSRELPQVTHPGLVEGLLGVLRYAATLHADLAHYGALSTAAAELEPAPVRADGPVVSERELRSALDWQSRARTYYSYGNSGTDAETVLPSVLTAVSELARRRSSGQAPGAETLPGTQVTDWPSLVPALAAVAYRAASAWTSDQERTALLFALDALTADGLAEGGGHWRAATVEAPSLAGTNNQRVVNSVVTTPHGFLVLIEFHYGNVNRGGRWSVVQFTTRSGDFALPQDWRLVGATPWEGPDRAWTTAFRAALADGGPLPWRPELAGELVARTGMGRSEAVLLLAGMPNVGDYVTNFLPTELRTTLGLKAAEANAGRDRLRLLPVDFALALLSAAVPADPAMLWTTGPDLDAIAATWLTRFERREPVPDELLVEAAKVLHGNDAVELVSGIADPAACTWLNTDAVLSVSEQHLKAVDDNGFHGRQVVGTALALSWLAYRLPVGAPVRAHLTEAYDLARARIQHPDLLVDVGVSYQGEPVYTVLGLPTQDHNETRDVGGWLVLGTGGNSTCRVYLRPSGIRKEHQVLLDGVLGALNYPDRRVMHALAVFEDGNVRNACAATATEGTDPAAYFQDPTVSAPELVAAVVERHGLGADAAVLYLQLLTLPDPTDANVARWTGWKPARLKVARAELAATDLVLTAKRARAGRSLFVPGGWLALKDPHLPIEEWKQPMFRFHEGTPMGPLVPLRPVGDLFRLAWQRVLDGDAPGYQELRTGGRR